MKYLYSAQVFFFRLIGTINNSTVLKKVCGNRSNIQKMNENKKLAIMLDMSMVLLGVIYLNDLYKISASLFRT